MVTSTARFSFKHVLAALPTGAPVSTGTLEAMGVPPYQASYLARHHWLTHLGRGVYMRTGDKLDRDACIAFLAQTIPGLHVGGKTALAWRGVFHNVAFHEHLSLWADKPVRMPTWFTECFSCTCPNTSLFSPHLPKGFGLRPTPNGREGVLVSVPERALLEMLSDVGKTLSLEDAVSISENVLSLREPVLDTLLAHSTRIKVIRLLHKLALDAGQPWAALALEHCKRIGGGKRWQVVTSSGERIDLKLP